MSNQITLEDYQKAEREIITRSEKGDFIIHCIIYVIVNAVLITLDVLYTPEIMWFYGPLAAWTIGITAHYLFAVRWIEKSLEKREETIDSRARELRKFVKAR